MYTCFKKWTLRASLAVAPTLFLAFPVVAQSKVPKNVSSKEKYSSYQSELTEGVKGYTEIADALASDNLAKAKNTANELKQSFSSLSKKAPLPSKQLVVEVANAAEKFSAASSLDEARESFKSLSKNVIALVSQDKDIRSNYTIFRCPMMKDYGKWFQPSKKAKNPFFGMKMQECGAVTSWE